MRDKVFIDTNILVYLQSGLDANKTKKCKELFHNLAEDNLIVLSTQIMQEFYVTMTKKLGYDLLEIKNLLFLFNDFEIINVNASIIFEAIDISVLHKISFWDSLVISSASSGNCKIIYSEDLNHGQMIGGIQIVNPFK